MNGLNSCQTADVKKLDYGSFEGGVRGKVLVTGAAGFIGSAVATRLIDMGYSVLTVDNLSTGSLDNIPKQCERIIGDLSDSQVVDKLVQENLKIIFHIAGQSGGMPSFEDPLYDLQANVSSTLLLLTLAHKIGCRQFVYASSMSVYGDQTIMPVSEAAALEPKSFYAVGKIASENYMRLYSSDDLKCVALRLNNTYGPGQSLGVMNQGMVRIFISQALKNNHIHVKGSKDRYRDFVYIDDVVESFIRAGFVSLDDNYSVFNVATSTATTVEELIQMMTEYFKKETTVEYSGSTPGDQFGIYCSNSLIAEKLNWTPQIMLNEGLMKTIDWALENNKQSALNSK
jgi:UDP-glucose 4-epimerase